MPEQKNILDALECIEPLARRAIAILSQLPEGEVLPGTARQDELWDALHLIIDTTEELRDG